MTQPDIPFCDGNQQQLNDESDFRLPYCTTQTNDSSRFGYTIMKSHWILSRHTFELDLIFLWCRLKHRPDYLFIYAFCFFVMITLRYQMKMELFVNAIEFCMRRMDDCNWLKCQNDVSYLCIESVCERVKVDSCSVLPQARTAVETNKKNRVSVI